MVDGHSANMPRTGPQSCFIKHLLWCLAYIAKHPTIGGWRVKMGLHKVSLIIDTLVSLDALRHWWPPAQSHPHLTHLSSEGGYGTMAGQETPAAICYRKTSAERHRHPSRLLDVTWEYGERPEESRGMFPNYRPG